ncbi:hypothetical protein FB451DRAFT_1162591 [Mycena latifolia]|nr:hypothetical protein FB451DRAFT_1162591 [Mycena latifolia]
METGHYGKSVNRALFMPSASSSTLSKNSTRGAQEFSGDRTKVSSAHNRSRISTSRAWATLFGFFPPASACTSARRHPPPVRRVTPARRPARPVDSTRGERLGNASLWLAINLKLKQKLQIHKGLQFLGDLYLTNGDQQTAISLFTVALEGFTKMNNLPKAVELWKTARPLFEDGHRP